MACRGGGKWVLLLPALTGCGGGSGPVPSSNQAPLVTITAPPDASCFEAGTPITFSGTALDPEEGPLPGDALAWTSDRDGHLGNGGTLTLSSLSVGLHTVTLTACDRQGLSGFARVRVTVLDPKAAPRATIQAPQDGALFRQGETIEFQGLGTDAEDQLLPASSLVWTSDRDGQLGVGPSIFVSHLSPGAHVITLSVTDREGVQGTARIALTIVAVNTPPVATIHSPAAGSIFRRGDPIVFIGSVVDAEDGILTGNAVVWSSIRDGQLGTGTAFVLDSLTAGIHTIILLAVDRGGAKGLSTVTITVEEPQPETGNLVVIID